MTPALVIVGFLLLLFGPGPDVTAPHWQVIGGHLIIAGIAYSAGKAHRNRNPR